MQSYFIYGLFEPHTNELRYIGHTVDPIRRYNEHLKPHLCRSGRGPYFWIKNLKEKGLLPKLKILEESTFEDRHENEVFYISYFKSLGCNLTNKNNGGLGNKGFKQSAYAIEKSRLANTGRPNWNKGKKWSAETLEKITIANRNRGPVSDETRMKLSAIHKGRKLSQEWKDNIRKSWIIRKAKKDGR